MAAAVVPPLLRTMCRMRSGPWREKWFPSWRNSNSGPLDVGHFFPEEIPERTAEELSGFFAMHLEERAMELIFDQIEAPMRVASTKRSVDSSMLRPARPRGA